MRTVSERSAAANASARLQPSSTLHYIREAEQRVEEGCNRAEAFAAAERSLTVRICDYVHHANA